MADSKFGLPNLKIGTQTWNSKFGLPNLKIGQIPSLGTTCTRDLPLQVNYAVGRLESIDLAKLFKSIGYHSLHRSVMGCSLMVTSAGVAG